MIFLIILGEILIHFFGGFYVWGKKPLVFAFPFSFFFFGILHTYFSGETTLMVLEVYLMCVIGFLSFN